MMRPPGHLRMQLYETRHSYCKKGRKNRNLLFVSFVTDLEGVKKEVSEEFGEA